MLCSCLFVFFSRFIFGIVATTQFWMQWFMVLLRSEITMPTSQFNCNEKRVQRHFHATAHALTTLPKYYAVFCNGGKLFYWERNDLITRTPSLSCSLIWKLLGSILPDLVFLSNKIRLRAMHKNHLKWNDCDITFWTETSYRVLEKLFGWIASDRKKIIFVNETIKRTMLLVLT